MQVETRIEMDDIIGKLKKACLKQSKEAASHYANQLSTFGFKFQPGPEEEKTYFDTLVKTLASDTASNDLFFKLSMVRVFDNILRMSIKVR